MIKLANLARMTTISAVLAIAAPVAAGSDGPGGILTATTAPDAFGTNTQWMVVHACEFDEETPNTPATGNVLATGYVHPIQPFSSWWTQLDLPAGAEVIQVVLIAYDVNPTEDVHLDFFAFESASTGTAPFMTGWGPVQTTGQPLYTTVPLILAASPVRIRALQDLNLDGIFNWVTYHLGIWTDNAADPSVQFFGAAVEWRRTISPAPAVATFADVPIGAFGFNHVEALAASGITAGCGGGNFCPNNAVTRVQMAVFLAKALGLHWPN